MTFWEKEKNESVAWEYIWKIICKNSQLFQEKTSLKIIILFEKQHDNSDILNISSAILYKTFVETKGSRQASKVLGRKMGRNTEN